MSDTPEMSAAEYFFKAQQALAAEAEAKAEAKARAKELTTEQRMRREAQAEAARELRKVRKGLPAEAWEGPCELCGSPEDIVLDHEHGSEGFRGFLCRTCNIGLGMFRDDPKLLLRASLYLLEHSRG